MERNDRNESKKISRPRQLYVGNNHREYIDILKRKKQKQMFPGEIK